MPPIAAAIFDLDGLLIDSEPLWQRAERSVFAAIGVPLTDAHCAQTTGLRIREVVAHWRAEGDWGSPGDGQVVARIVEQVCTHIREEGTMKPGAREAVLLARDAGLRVALASSSHRAVIDTALERLGLADAFEVICSAEHEPLGKPDPAVYLTAARQLGLAPSQCVALEDSLPGVRAAKAAGMRAVAVPETPGPGYAIADRVLSSLLELDRTALLGSSPT
ncbi:MAG: hexitol phosphatase HxpB [Myxococcales bacterium]|nr:hexitol phosphatase HxpB [Myxococcales bacterium]